MVTLTPPVSAKTFRPVRTVPGKSSTSRHLSQDKIAVDNVMALCIYFFAIENITGTPVVQHMVVLRKLPFRREFPTCRVGYAIGTCILRFPIPEGIVPFSVCCTDVI